MTASPTPADPQAVRAAVQLRLAGQTAIAWAAFDASWYLAAYASACSQLADTSPGSVLYYYLQHGRCLGHSPSIFFDEGWYLETYPDVAAEIGQGISICGFDHYCRVGHRDRSPHWLFDEKLYRRNYPRLTDDALRSADLANGYDHYLRHGSRENRIGHFLFDPEFYRAQLATEAAREAEAVGPFRHYLDRIAAGRPEVPASRYFEPTWYLAKHEEVAGAAGAVRWQCAPHHYLCNRTPTAFDPLPQFSEAYYLARYPHAASAVERREHRNGYEHFLSEGRFQPLSPNPAIDLAYYERHAVVQSDLRQGRALDAFTHYLAIGRAAGLPTMPPPREQLTDIQATGLFRRKAEDLLPLFGRSPLSFACTGEPELSVVMAVRDRCAMTLMTLGSLRNAYPGAAELVLVDAASTDETRQIEQFVEGATVLRLDDDIGFAAGRNAGLHTAGAGTLLFLNNEVELAPGAVAAALRRLRSDATIGAVGGKVIRPNGVLCEAGGVIGAGGSIQACCAGASPQCPEASFVRDVDFCSSAFLLVRAALLRDLDGFDSGFGTMHYADADLGVRIAAAGFRIVYDPAVVIYDHRDDEPELALEADRQAFSRKHGEGARIVPAAEPQARGKRLLFIETNLQRLTGSGFTRSNDIVRAMASIGCRVTVFPLRSSPFNLAAVYADMPDTVEIMHDRTIADLPDFLAARAGEYDAVWVGRTHNLDSLAGILGTAFTGDERRPRIILDTEAIAALRDAARADLPDANEPFDLDRALAREFANASLCDGIVAVSPHEAGYLSALGCSDTAVLGHVREVHQTPRTFDERAGILFVGAIHEKDSPNYDSLCWFVDSVLPLVEEALGWETRLTIAGYVEEKVDMGRFRGHPRITMRGMVADLEPLYDAHRLFAAPTRFAAGLPYKIYEAASYGLPVVASELLCRQMGWEDGQELLAADTANPARFAERIVALYRGEALWRQLQTRALERLRRENGREGYADAIRRILGGCGGEGA